MFPMSITHSQIAGLIAAAEGTQASFDCFGYENRFDIDRPDVVKGIEDRMVQCVVSIRKCLTHMVSMSRVEVRSCIEIAKTTVQTLRSLQRLRPDGLEHMLILEDVLYEERLSEMYANQADIQVKENIFQHILDEDGYDPADWWKQT